MLPDSPAPLYEDEDLFTTQTLREMSAEIVRERCFENLRQEIPYGLAVVTTAFKEDEGRVARVACDIWLDKESHKAIVIGAKGSGLKKIGVESRKEIERLLGRQIHLELRAVAKPGWAKDARRMEELGYVVPE